MPATTVTVPPAAFGIVFTAAMVHSVAAVTATKPVGATSHQPGETAV